MPIKKIVTNVTGLAGVEPRVIYIDTNDTLANVMALGYLNQAVGEGYNFTNRDMALVTTQTVPFIVDRDVDPSVHWLEIRVTRSNTFAGYNYSLINTAGAITGINVTAPITSTGGLNPTIGLATPLAGTYGGTGVNNGANTISIDGNVEFIGAFTSSFTFTGNTAVTFPTTGTLATVGNTVSSITGTVNQITVSAPTGAVTLSLPATVRINTSILDSNSNTILAFTPTALAVNYLRIDNAAAGQNLNVAAAGVSANIELNLKPQGTCIVNILNTTGNAELRLFNTAAFDYVGIAAPTVLAGYTVTMPAAQGAANTVLTNNGSGTLAWSLPSSAGEIVQVVTAQTNTVVTTTTALPFDDSIPQSGEGAEAMTITITPTSATNRLVIEFNLLLGVNGDNGTVALFQDAGASALKATCVFMNTSTSAQTPHLVYTMIAGTTSATTFSLRFGANTGGTTSRFLGTSAADRYDTVALGTAVIYEVKV